MCKAKTDLLKYEKMRVTTLAMNLRMAKRRTERLYTRQAAQDS